MPPPIRIRIGGEIDSSLPRSLATAQQMVGRAEKAIQQEKKRTSQTASQEARKQLRAQEELTRATEALDRQRARGLHRQFQEQERGAQRAAMAQQRAMERAHASERREAEKTARAAVRAIETERRAREREERAALRKATRSGESFARRTSHRASRFLTPEAPLGSMAMRGLGDVARGAGIDFSVQGMVQRNVQLQTAATDLSNSGFQAGQSGPNGKRVDPNELMAQARAVGGSLGMDSADALSGLAQFQKITGDLALGRSLLMDMATLSKATGTSLEDMAAAAANVSNGLGDTPDKAQVLDAVMRTIAGQGKLGAVEISDMATQMARVAASASFFEGPRDQLIGKMGALTQIARMEGGAPSAAESARSVVGFSNTMKKSARISAFRKEGIDVFSDKSQTKIKDPIELIKESLLATGGDLEKMNKLFMDVIGARAVGGLQKTFAGAGGGKAGIAKVDEQVNRMLKAQMSKQEVKESAERSGDTVAAKAARFQNELDKVTQGVMSKLVPALEKAAPAILKFAEVVGSIATWAVDNPKMAIGAAITASIARAGIESVFRSGIERLILGAAGGNAGGVGKLAGTLGAAGTIAAVAVTTLVVGMAVIDQLFMDAQKGQRENVEKDVSGTGAANAAEAALLRGDLEGAKKKAEQAVQLKESALAGTKAQAPGTGGKMLEGVLGFFGGGEAFKSRDAVLEKTSAAQQKELAASKALLERIALAIEAQGGAGGDVPPDGRVSQ